MSRNDSAPHSGVKVRTISSIIDDLAKASNAVAARGAPLGAAPPAADSDLRPAGDSSPPEVSPLPSEIPETTMRAPRTFGSDSGSGAEIELKLLSDRDHLASFQDAPVIAGNARNRGVRRHLRAVYYDTEDRGLRQAGFSLRVRQSGSRFTQTVKAESADDPLRRGEWEAALPTSAPDLSLALPLLPAKLRSKLGRDGVRPVFTADIHRLARNVSLPSGTVEVSFDHGTLKVGERTLPVCEIELELKDGATQTIYDLALRLLEHGPLRPSVRSKAARGFDLADAKAPTAPRPSRPVLDPAAPLDQAFATILRGALRHLLRSMPAAEDGQNPEGVHQARVALRRLRSAFGLMRTVAASASLETFRAEAKWLADSLGGARDCDIFADETLLSIEAALPELDGFAELRRVAEEKRLAGYTSARMAMADQRTSRFLLELGGWIEQRGWRSNVSPEVLGTLGDPAIAFADRTLSALHAKVMKRGRRFKSLSPEERHKLRIAVKKLRYATDFLGPLYRARKIAKRYTAALADLQEELGRYNDMATTRKIVASFAEDPVGRSQAAGAVLGWQAQGLARAEPRLRSAWRSFCESRQPWASVDDSA